MEKHRHHFTGNDLDGFLLRGTINLLALGVNFDS